MRGPAVIYVGNLPDKVREQDLLEVFEKVPQGSSARRRVPGILGTALSFLIVRSMDASVLWISRCPQDRHHLRSSSSKNPGASSEEPWNG